MPAFSKLLEQVIADRLIDFFDRNNCVTQCQHGFRKNRSTTTALSKIMDTVLTALDRQECVQLTCCDLSRAFDTVDHGLLLDKLYYYGVRGNVHDLLSSYLSNRKQYVEILSKKSSMGAVERGVPQGSILGPLLFIIYVNDLEVNLSADQVCLYADDTSFVIKETSREGKSTKAETVMREAERWFASNKLKMNPNKTQHLDFIMNRREDSTNIKILGLHVDSRLTWAAHIDDLAGRLSAAIYSIRRIKSVSTYQAARLTYFANFHSIAVYGLQFWGMAPEATRIFLLQKRAIRAMVGLKQDETCKQAFITEKILTLPSMYILTTAKCIHRDRGELHINGETHNYNTRFRNDLQTPYHRLQTTQRFADFWGSKIFNKLPEKVKCLPTEKMSAVLKQHLMMNAFYTVDEFLNCGNFCN